MTFAQTGRFGHPRASQSTKRRSPILDQHQAGTVRSNFKPETTIIARMADACRDMGPNFATRDRLRDEYGFSDLEIDLYGVDARTRANADFVRQAHEAAQDHFAREDVEGTRRTLLVSIPVADLCQAWQGLRSGAGCSTLEATARIVESCGGGADAAGAIRNAPSPAMLEALRKADSFISGFEDDELNDVTGTLMDIRTAIALGTGGAA